MALALLGFGLAGVTGQWSSLPAPLLLIGILWLPGVVALGPCVGACHAEARGCPLHGPGRFALESVFSLVLLGVAVLPLFATASDLAVAALTLGVSHILLAAAALVVTFGSPSTRGFGRQDRHYNSQVYLWIAFALAVAVLLPAVHRWAGGTVDDWWDLAFIRAYAQRPMLSFDEPVLGSGAVHPRFAWNAWLVLQSLIVEFAPGGGGAALQSGVLPLVVCVLVVSAVCLLAMAVFARSRAVIATVLFVPVWLYGTEALPFFTRLHQDKFVAGLVLVPVLLAVVIEYLRTASTRFLAFAGLAALALCSVHSLLFAVGLLGVAACAAAHLSRGDRASVRSMANVCLVVCAPLVYPLWQAWALGSWFSAQGIGLELADNPVVRAHLRLGRLIGAGAASYIVNPAAVFGPASLIAVAGLVVAARQRQRRDAAYLVWLTLVPCVLVFVPYLAALTGRLLVPWMIYRVAWLVPIALLAGFLFDRVAADQTSRLQRWLRFGLCSAATALLVFPVARDRYRRDMAEHPGVRAQHPRGTTWEVYRFLGHADPPGTVLAPPGISRLLPALSGRSVVAGAERATLVFAGSEAAAYSRLRDRATFFAEGTDAAERARIAARYGTAFAVFRRTLIASGDDYRWLERASAEGFMLAYERDRGRTWAASEEGLRRRLPRGWQVVMRNRDYFVVTTIANAGGVSKSQWPQASPGQAWLEAFAPHHPDLPSAGELLASAVGYPGARVELWPVPLGLGISDRLAWTTTRALWDDRPSEVEIEISMSDACMVDAIEIEPHLASGVREVLEIRFEEVTRRLYVETGQSLFVRVKPRLRKDLSIHLRSMLGSAFALRDLRVWGDAASCGPSWQPLLHSRLPGESLTTGDFIEFAGRYPNSGRAWLGLARDASGKGRADDARALLRVSLVADPRRVVNWVELGLLRDAQGEFAGAVSAYSQALRADSNSAWARGCMAWARLRSKHGLSAVYHGWRAARLDPGYADAYTIGALIAAYFGMDDEAVDLLSHAMELDPRRSWAFIERARGLSEGGQRAEALELLRSFVARVPDDQSALRALAALSAQGQAN